MNAQQNPSSDEAKPVDNLKKTENPGVFIK